MWQKFAAAEKLTTLSLSRHLVAPTELTTIAVVGLEHNKHNILVNATAMASLSASTHRWTQQRIP